MTIAQVVRLLQCPIPSNEPINWPSPETSYDEDLLTSATVLFLQPARANRAKRALRIALGGEKFELLIGFLTYIRLAHYWTLMHPELALEDDVKELLPVSRRPLPGNHSGIEQLRSNLDDRSRR